MPNTNLYKTTDMPLAIVLSMKFPVKELINNNGRGVFVFDTTVELEEMINQFYNHQLLIDPLTLFEAQKSIKNRLYSQVKGGNND